MRKVTFKTSDYVLQGGSDHEEKYYWLLGNEGLLHKRREQLSNDRKQRLFNNGIKPGSVIKEIESRN